MRIAPGNTSAAISSVHGSGAPRPRNAAQAFGIARATCSNAVQISSGIGATRSTAWTTTNVNPNSSGEMRMHSGRPDNATATTAKTENRQLARRFRRCSSRK
jgi:hypothetical protein